MTHSARVIPFVAVRMCWTFELSLDDVLQGLLLQLGHNSIPPATIDALEPGGSIEPIYPDRGILPERTTNLELYGVTNASDEANTRGSERMIIIELGNSAAKVKLTRADPQTALFTSVRMLLCERAGESSCSLTYVVPSTLLLHEYSSNAVSHAKELDVSIDRLVRRASKMN